MPTSSPIRRRARERGITGVVSLFAAVALLVLVLGGVIVGMVAVTKFERQAQADALATTAARIAFEEGLDEVCDHPALGAVVIGNSQTAANTPCPFNQLVVKPDGRTVRRFVSDVDSRYQSPFRIVPVDTDVVATAQADIPETVSDDLELSYPKLVLVLDYSGSMGLDYGGGQTRIQVLRQAVEALISARYRIQYGLVTFNESVRQVVDIEEELRVADELLPAEEDILNVIGDGVGGFTNYASPLRQASNMLQRVDPTGYYVLFITDGVHNRGGDPEAAAADVREGLTDEDTDDVGIFTLFIGDNPDVERYLEGLGGTANNPGDPAYSFSAADPDELLNVFDAIIGSIVCRFGPLGADPGMTSNDMKVWTRAGNGVETEVLFTNFEGNRPADFEDSPYFEYLPGEDKIRMNQAACDRVIEADEELVLRFGRVSLVQ